MESVSKYHTPAISLKESIFSYNKKTMRYAVVRSGAKKLPTSTDKN